MVADLVSFIYNLGIDLVEKELLCLNLSFDNDLLRINCFRSVHLLCYFGELVLTLIIEDMFLY